MTFELEADGVRVRCSSPVWARKLVEKGARLVDPAKAVYLRLADETPPLPPRKKGSKRRRATSKPRG